MTVSSSNRVAGSPHQDLTELSVAELFSNDHYRIPAYQRNYAWGQAEITQLIQDVMDGAGQHGEDDYYIGTLVVARRADGSYETIDGQQRHTTLSILLAVLKNSWQQELAGIKQTNLAFDSRPQADRALKGLFYAPARADEAVERSIIAASDIARRELAQCNAGKVAGFTRYLLHHVKIMRVVVPEDTSLNHYFEIMNNRGEQLEKHEVLKARLMQQLADDRQRQAFAQIWQACADMQRYVQLNIDHSVRDNVFGADWNTLPQDFNQLCEVFGEQKAVEQSLTLAQLIASPALQGHVNRPDAADRGMFSSIISFPNFLLQVLRVMSGKNVPLDDKRLLESFSQTLSPQAVPQFIITLLQARMLFDRFIIRRENDEEWSLKTLTRYDSSFSYTLTAKDDAQNKQLTMLLAMFHVSYPAQVYKHWLNAALRYLLNHWQAKKESRYGALDSGAYLQFLETLSDRFFFGRFGKTAQGEPLDYYALIYQRVAVPAELDEEYLCCGTQVQNFIFNRLDYLLWRTLSAGEKLPGVELSRLMPKVNSFSFTFRNSVEHYYPQQPLSGSPLQSSAELPEGVDSFGNLCLISHSDNSRLSNYLPAAKKEHYRHRQVAESLKQLVMMSYPDWGPQAPQVIARHQQQMIALLCRG